MPPIFIIIAALTLLLTIGLCVVVVRSEGFRRYWRGLTPQMRIAVGVVLGPIALLGPPLFVSATLFGNPVTIVGFVLLIGVFVFMAWDERRLRRIAGEQIVCARCGYLRPDEADEHTLLCPECSNGWWGTLHESASIWVRTGAMPRALYLQRKRCFLWSVPLLGCGAIMLASTWSNAWLVKALPTPAVAWLADSWSGGLQEQACEEILVHRSVSQARLDAMLDAITVERNKRKPLPHGVGNLLVPAVSAGRFGQGALDRFYGGSLDWTLDVEVDVDAGLIIPRLRLIVLANTINISPNVVSPGFRIDNGPWQQAVTGLCLPQWMAYSYEDYFLPGPNGQPYEARDDPSGDDSYRGFQPISIAGLAPGRYTMTARVHMYVMPHPMAGWSHSFFGPSGVITPNPQSIWHETRDLTATFTIPASTR